MRKVEVVDYNPEWEALFQSEATRLIEIFGEQLVAIHHIGSTSVPGLAAKPIIDIMPVVKNIDHVDERNEKMVAIGYEPKGENGIAGRRYFQKGGDNRTHHVHIFYEGSEDIVRHLAFRDYVRTSPEIKQEYGDLKKHLAAKYTNDIAAYIAGKNQLVKQIEAQALRWYGSDR
ncbi:MULTISPECIES: GrpB family protein [Bacillaceae]|uniref:GrpB family protein n=1 Tax=Evansella alkalicola TaxID=745819 RepID=A0ABS6K052_9BACI|nr:MULTISPECIES: GrpB family protein [Bacillaceae]MBU9724228.1 GrpB family protein [Bacillus alkalicola]